MNEPDGVAAGASAGAVELARLHRVAWLRSSDQRAAAGGEADVTSALLELLDEGQDPVVVMSLLVEQADGADDPYLGFVAATVLEAMIDRVSGGDRELGVRIARRAEASEVWRQMLQGVWLDLPTYGRLPDALRAQLPRLRDARRRALRGRA